jgi:hypothetical protein
VEHEMFRHTGIIGATGIVTKELKKCLETIPGKHSIDSLQKTAVLATSLIIRKVLQSETLSLSGGVHHCFKRKSTGKTYEKKREENNNNNNNNNTQQNPSYTTDQIPHWQTPERN